MMNHISNLRCLIQHHEEIIRQEVVKERGPGDNLGKFVEEERKNDLRLVFLFLHQGYLEGRAHEPNAAYFDNGFDTQSLPSLIRKKLSKKVIDIVSRKTNQNLSKTEKERNRRTKRAMMIGLAKVLEDGNYSVLKYHDSMLKLKLDTTGNQIHECRVTVDGTSKWGYDDTVKDIPYPELLVWKVAIDISCVDLFVDTATIKLLAKLQTFGDEHILECPTAIAKLSPVKNDPNNSVLK